MSRRQCVACGEDFNVGKRRPVLFPSGELRPELVCSRCAKRAVKIVPVVREAVCGSCGESDASVCRSCANDHAHKAVTMALLPFAEHLNRLAIVARADGREAQAEGLDQAADILAAARAVAVEPMEKGNGKSRT